MFVSRAGLKLQHALDHFAVDVRERVCADFGANVGGFTDCLLQRGAARVYAIDTGYGTLAWSLRNDPRVVVMERTNALHAAPHPVDLVVIDLAWTPQRLAIPAALNWLNAGGRIITLIKPHYEARGEEKQALHKGVLDEAHAAQVAERVAGEASRLGARLLGLTPSPIRGGASKRTRAGNAEWLAFLAPSTAAPGR